ncbi:MAG: FkbM family methyltransferase [Mangrovicoccus sp.]
MSMAPGGVTAAPPPKPASAYLRQILDLPRRPRIADVGANPLSPPPYAKLLTWCDCDLWGFEPQKEAFEKLLKEAAPNQHYFNHAVADGKEHIFYEAPNGAFSSLFPAFVPGFKLLDAFPRAYQGVTEHRLTTVALDSLQDLPKLDLLKIDIQGGENLVFLGGAQKLSDAVCVIPEMRFLRLYQGEPMLAGTDALLSDMGFMLHKFLHQKSMDIGSSQKSQVARKAIASQLVDGDAVYIRDITDPDALSSEQWKFLALFADGVFGSFDLVLHALDVLAERHEIPSDAASQYLAKLPKKYHKEAADA